MTLRAAWRRRRWSLGRDDQPRDRDRGVVSAELALAIGFILLPITFLMLAVVQWPERQGIATGAASEGARSAALANSPEEARTAMAVRVTEVLSSAGIDPSAVSAELSGSFAPGEHITVTVTIDMPAVVVPLVGTLSVNDHAASSTERIEVHRSFSE